MTPRPNFVSHALFVSLLGLASKGNAEKEERENAKCSQAAGSPWSRGSPEYSTWGSSCTGYALVGCSQRDPRLKRQSPAPAQDAPQSGPGQLARPTVLSSGNKARFHPQPASVRQGPPWDAYPTTIVRTVLLSLGLSFSLVILVVVLHRDLERGAYLYETSDSGRPELPTAKTPCKHGTQRKDIEKLSESGTELAYRVSWRVLLLEGCLPMLTHSKSHREPQLGTSFLTICLVTSVSYS
ncbi:hypothetical protein BD289DRAFT_273430 [Coniella lustricola]|uniref:Uncharacterized protein n=1 Tax=Coniella lustricola TaxID=2025994 RepID=A0A2T3A6T3_9PEZI|nr:hypothetical protein BD289DRAFT_273430 [Coniella lustricola]